MDGIDVVVSWDGGQAKVKTDGGGVIKTEIPIHVGHVTVEAREDKWELAVGHLDPLEHTKDEGKAGCTARLKNLGYLGAEHDDDAIAEALYHFQVDHEIPRSGALDAATIQKLLERHGS
jgi:hypothetical protein